MHKAVVVLGSGEVDMPTYISAPATHNWFRFYPLSISRYWRQRELEITSNHRRNGGKWVRYLDVGALHARYAGVRCDGVHFFSWHDQVSAAADHRAWPHLAGDARYVCQPSVGVWDGLVLQALEASGLVERCSCTSWKLLPRGPREGRRMAGI